MFTYGDFFVIFLLMVKFELKRHELVEKPKTQFVSHGVFTIDVDYGTIDLVANPAFTNNTHIIGGSNIIATRSNTTYTENLEVTGEVRQHGGSRYNFVNESLEVWDNRTESWRELAPSFRMTTRIPIKGNIFKRIYDYIVQRFSI